MRVSPNNRITVATSEGSSLVHFIDNQTLKLVATVLVGTRPRVVTFTPDGRYVWASSEIGGMVSVIDVATHQVVHSISFAIPGMRAESIQPVGITMSKDGSQAFIALGPANHVAVVNTKTYTVGDYILVGQRPWHMALSPDGSKLYVVNGFTNDVTVVDAQSLKPEVSVNVGRLPWGIAVVP
jgi:PQQ-dependent catabolism-associated beta-propeller protein